MECVSLGQYLSQKLLRPLRLRLVDHLRWRPFLDDLAVRQNHDAIRRAPGKTNLVRHDQQRQAVSLQVF
jgi:hypothetical protein